MTKAEMEKLLIEKYGYAKKDLKDDKGNPLKNDKLETLIENEEVKARHREEEIKKPEVTVDDANEQEETHFIDETIFQANHNLKDSDLVLCMAGVNGELNFSSPLSNFRTSTRAFGQTMKIPYGDLSYVHNIAPDAFEQGKIIVLNKSVQDEFGLSDSYKTIITPKNVRKVLQLEADELKEYIGDMPKGLKVALYDEARKMFQKGQIDSIKTVKVLEEEYGVSLEDNAPVSDTIIK